ncbi:MnhB domain-containing protein [Pseudonocardia sp. ICBG601]|uniref:MnhB domain-containing protein n=1 Tax=Pseudonocardia sp. ICBG601 TaxID=2846759 RepID=UPI001CF61D9C|nr:MnhB domain-containing protein [Pseudonocardia sp. ICBG601]
MLESAARLLFPGGAGVLGVPAAGGHYGPGGGFSGGLVAGLAFVCATSRRRDDNLGSGSDPSARLVGTRTDHRGAHALAPVAWGDPVLASSSGRSPSARSATSTS